MLLFGTSPLCSVSGCTLTSHILPASSWLQKISSLPCFSGGMISTQNDASSSFCGIPWSSIPAGIRIWDELWYVVCQAVLMWCGSAPNHTHGLPQPYLLVPYQQHVAAEGQNQQNRAFCDAVSWCHKRFAASCLLVSIPWRISFVVWGVLCNSMRPDHGTAQSSRFLQTFCVSWHVWQTIRGFESEYRVSDGLLPSAVSCSVGFWTTQETLPHQKLLVGIQQIYGNSCTRTDAVQARSGAARP